MRRPANIGASVRARLLNLARERNQPFQLLLTRYVLERLLFRLSRSAHRDRFVLKGAMLMAAWFDDPHRPTQDLDLLGFGNPDPAAMLAVFREVCAVAEDDGVAFDVGALTVEDIREDMEYDGLRLKTFATLDGARIRVLVDIGFGDAAVPEERELPVLLDQPAPRLRVYPPEAVIAEKFQAMVMLGRANSRMKDFYDIWVLATLGDIDADRLAAAIRATFERRGTAIPEALPDALTPAFADDPHKQQQWTAFVANVAMQPGTLADLIAVIGPFLMAAAERARGI
ncbi:MAG: nucleotidyl transferase AbiEii/AbiGii toxin family protein [Hyphomicrobiaceae bacterium]